MKKPNIPLHRVLTEMKNKRKIAIIGAGQAGLQLGIHLLLTKLYDVSIYSDKTATQLKQGRILSSQGMFSSALQYEQKLGLNLWDNLCPKNTAVTFSLAAPDQDKPIIHWQGIVNAGQAIDQRLKLSQWMNIFEEKDGKLIIDNIDPDKLACIANQNDLTIVSTGKGKLGGIFPRHDEHSLFTTPQRALCCLYVKKMIPAYPQGVRVNPIPGIGEFFSVTGLTHSGACEMMLFEGIPGLAMDCWDDITSTAALIIKAKEILKTYVPFEAERYHSIELADENAFLTGRYTPVIRHATTTLPSGNIVLGLGDAIILNDPIAGQGANHACKSAYLYAERIIERGDKPFDKTWMEETSQSSWEKYGCHSTQLSNLLLQPPADEMMNTLKQATTNQTIADKIANVFNDPSTLSALFNHNELIEDKTLNIND